MDAPMFCKLGIDEILERVTLGVNTDETKHIKQWFARAKPRVNNNLMGFLNLEEAFLKAHTMSQVTIENGMIVIRELTPAEKKLKAAGLTFEIICSNSLRKQHGLNPIVWTTA